MIENPEVINILLDTYIDVVKDTVSKEEMEEKDTKKDNDEPDPFDQFLDEQKKDKVSAGLVPPPPKINFQIIA